MLVVGDVVGHGLQAGRRAAFVRTAFAATAPFSDDPCRLLSWANTALVERAGTSTEFVTAGCMTYLPRSELLRWAYAGHPAGAVDRRRERARRAQAGDAARARRGPRVRGGLAAIDGAGGVLLYTDGLTEARHDGKLFGLEGVSAALGELDRPSPSEAIDVLRARVAEFAHGGLTDDLCLLAARIAASGS